MFSTVREMIIKLYYKIIAFYNLQRIMSWNNILCRYITWTKLILDTTEIVLVVENLQHLHSYLHTISDLNHPHSCERIMLIVIWKNRLVDSRIWHKLDSILTLLFPEMKHRDSVDIFQDRNRPRQNHLMHLNLML